ncbi:hypothetical protein [Streptomyces sp. NPDC016675]|uniref:hypothetical protein n=1 Tax=Streptomyces sp. NPDC016675 TaxID=3364970 RepID=UPI0036F9F975
MGMFVEAATTFPVLFFTVAAIVVAGFWLLVAMGAADVRCFDEDVDADSLGLGGVPVAVSLSVLTALAWAGSLGAVLLLEAVVSMRSLRALTSLVIFLVVPVIGWCGTRLLVGPLRRRFPQPMTEPRFCHRAR